MTRSVSAGVTLVVLLMAGCRGPDAAPPLREDPVLAAELQAEAARDTAARERGKALGAMTLADAAKLEATLVEHPEDLETRGRLLAFYRMMGAKLQPREANVAAIRRHVAWVTEHHPDSILLTAVIRREEDAVGYAQIRELWGPHLEKRDASLAVLNLASVFFAGEPQVAERLLLRMQQLPTGPAEAGSIHDRSVTPLWWRLGGLYAQVLRMAGDPGSNVDRAYADKVKARLAASRDAPLLAAVAQSLISYGEHADDDELTALARAYLQQAMAINANHPHVGHVWAQVESSAVARVVANARGRTPASYADVPDRKGRLACFAEVEYRTAGGSEAHARLTTAKALAEEALVVASSLSPEASSSLLKHGERESIVAYLEEASKTRTSGDRTRMLEEAAAIRDGRMPARYQRLLSMGHI